MEENQRLEELYQLARLHNLANAKSDFASFIGVDVSTLSHALKNDGRVSLENTIKRAEHALMKAGVDVSKKSGINIDGQRERLLAFLESEGLKITEFERSIGAPNGTVRHLNNITGTMIEKINGVYPKLNTSWLVYGIGEMYRTNTGQIREDKQTAQDNNAPVFQNTGKGGNNVTQGAPASTIDKLIEEMRAQRESSDKQIDRLLTIIETITNTSK